MGRQPHALLIYPPVNMVEEVYHFWSPRHSTSFPLALLRLSTYLKKNGYKVSYIDTFHAKRYFRIGNFNEWKNLLHNSGVVYEASMGGYNPEGRTRPVFRVGYSRDEIVERLRAVSAVDEIYITSIYTWTWQTTHELVELCKEIHPQARVIVGGIYPTLCPEKAAESGADEVFAGRMPEIEHEWSDLAIATAQSPDCLVVKSTIGCPNGCTYCAVDKLEGRHVLARDPADVVAEIVDAYHRFGLKMINFWESNPLVKRKEHFEPLLRGIADTGLPLKMAMPEGLQTSYIDDELAALYKRAGMHAFMLTVETTDPEWGKRTHRPTGYADMKRAIDVLQRHKFDWHQIRCILLIGQPEQTRTSILRDILSVYSAGAIVSFLFYTLIPGTKDYDTHAKWREGKKLEDLDPLLFPFASPQLTIEDIEKMQRYFHERYIPVERIQNSHTDDDLIREMQQLIADDDYFH